MLNFMLDIFLQCSFNLPRKKLDSAKDDASCASRGLISAPSIHFHFHIHAIPFMDAVLSLLVSSETSPCAAMFFHTVVAISSPDKATPGFLSIARHLVVLFTGR